MSDFAFLTGNRGELEKFFEFLESRGLTIEEPTPQGDMRSVSLEELLKPWLEFCAGAPAYDPDFGDNRVCKCGHAYHRHFDSYGDMYPIGCKYCSECRRFVERE